MSNCQLTEQELWSGLDRCAPEIEEHLAECGVCRQRAAGFHESVGVIKEASTPAAPPLPDQIGPYRIHRRVGEGGMGIVYEGEQQSPSRRVAVKVIRGGPHVDQYRVKLFQREVQTLARLKHPAIGAVYDAGVTSEGQHYFVMELVAGKRLDMIAGDSSFTRLDRLDIFCKICEAIQYAHHRGVIHRDLKPSNILVDEEGNPKILDFGLARITDPDSGRGTLFSEVGKLMGTLPFMSPEEARGDVDSIDVRSDVYSLGVILFQLLANALPYAVSRAALHEAVRVICEEPPKRPSSVDVTLRGDLDTIVLKALEKERARRYQSPAAIAEDIERFLADEPILARRASAVYNLRKWVMRHRNMVAVASLVLLLMIGAQSWLRWTERSLEVHETTSNKLISLTNAANAHQMGLLLHDVGRWERAKVRYETALQILDRLGEVQYAVRRANITVDLARLLIQRPVPDDFQGTDDESDYFEAEAYLLEALDVYRAWGSVLDPQRQAAIEALLELYSPEAWDDPVEFARWSGELKRNDRSTQGTVADSSVSAPATID